MDIQNGCVMSNLFWHTKWCILCATMSLSWVSLTCSHLLNPLAPSPARGMGYVQPVPEAATHMQTLLLLQAATPPVHFD